MNYWSTLKSHLDSMKNQINDFFRKRTFLEVLAWVLLGISLYLIFVFVHQLLRTYDYEWSCIKVAVIEIFNKTPGDFLWGTIGILLTFATSLLMLSTFSQQRKQFTEQHLTEHSQRFENTFFNLMTMLYNVRKSTNKDLNNSDYSEKDIESYAKAFIEQSKEDDNIASLCKRLDESDITETEKENIGAEFGNKFSDFSKQRMNPLAYYFRYVFNLINYVTDYWRADETRADKYLKFIQAQMSDAEMSLIFYNCLSALSKDSNFQKTFFHSIDTHNFLQNIDERWLIARSNHKLYPHTRFRFLSRDEFKKKYPTTE